MTNSDKDIDIDWMDCELIERIPGKVSGRPIVRGTRILPDAIVNSYDMGESMGHLLFQLMLNMRREIEARMTELGLTDAQWKPLWMLKMGRADTAFELAREMSIDAGREPRRCSADEEHLRGGPDSTIDVDRAIARFPVV